MPDISPPPEIPLPLDRPFRVQVICDVTLEYFRNVVMGARHYAFSTRRITMASRWLEHETDDIEQLVQRDQIDGIIAAAHYASLEHRLAALPIPVVNVSNVVDIPTLPLVTQDDVQVGRIAAEHLLACGCRNFGFWGEKDSRFSDQRLAGFRTVLRENGLENALHVEGQLAPVPPIRDSMEDIYERMLEWLVKINRPSGVFCVLDTQAMLMLRAVWAQGWRVPEDVAVLGAGDDDFWVKFENVPLSSIKLPSFNIGYKSAQLLDELITQAPKKRRKRGRQSPTKPVIRMLPVNEIASRQSTDTLFVTDQAIARAVQYIRDNAARDVYVEEIVRVSGIARTALQRRFKNALGHSLMDELTRARIVLAQSYLAGGNLPMEAIAEQSGFPNSRRFSMVFRAQTGMTPTEYRRRFRQSPLLKSDKRT